MARQFVRASGEKLDKTSWSPTITAYPITFLCRFKMDTLPSPSSWQFTVTGPGTPYGSYLGFTTQSDGTFRFQFNNNTTSNVKAELASSSVTTGVWYTAVGTLDASDIDVYLNSTSTTANGTNTYSWVSWDQITIGDIADFPNKHDGKVDTCAIWNVKLTTPEIAALMTGLYPTLIRPSSLRNLFMLNEDTGTSAKCFITGVALTETGTIEQIEGAPWQKTPTMQVTRTAAAVVGAPPNRIRQNRFQNLLTR